MNQAVGPRLTEIPDGATAVSVFVAQVAARGDAPALRTRDGVVLTWAEWHEASRAVARALLADGLSPGGRVAILAGNRPLWPIAEMGVLMAGGVSVGIYPTSAVEQVADLLDDAEARSVIVDTDEQLATVREAAREVRHVRRIVVADERAGCVGPREQPMSAWLAAGGAEDDAALARRGEAVTAADDAIFIYTSGSTGIPKAARLSHRSVVANAASVVATLGLTADDTALSFLPYSHAAERLFGLHARIAAGMEALLVDDVRDVFAAAAAYGPTLFGGLPRFFEKAWAAMQAAPGGEAAVLAAHVGTRVRIATSGGAALPRAVAEGLAAHGLRVLGAYGLTEHLCTAMQRPGTPTDVDTAGPPMPGTTVRIADDGEILVRRSALTFTGYWHREAETSGAFTADGKWLRTGDLGELTADGRLRITGRLKELIALSGGKKVAPLAIESALTASPLLAHAVCYGEGQPYVVALLAPADAAREAFAAAHGIALEDVVTDARFVADVEALVASVNGRLSRPEQVKRWVLLPHELSVAAGELTPTLKPRRDAIAARHAARLSALFTREVA